MENTTGPIKVFFVGTLPKETYTDVNELARDIANNLAVDADNIIVPLIPLEDLKGEKGEEGPRGLKGDNGAKGEIGPTGTPGTSGLSPFQTLNIETVGYTTTWILSQGIAHYNASLTLVEGTGSIQLIITGASSGMHGTLKVKQNLACNGVLGLPSNSYQEDGGFLLTTADPGGTPPIPVPATPFVDLLHWVYDGAIFYWTINRHFVQTA